MQLRRDGAESVMQEQEARAPDLFRDAFSAGRG
jgi:hypothetical protein